MTAPPPPLPFDITIRGADDDYETHQAGLHAAAWLCTGVATCAVAMKLYTKARIVKLVGWDDFIILLSLALSIISASLASSAVTEGLGRHTTAVLAAPDGTQRLAHATTKLQVGYALHIGAFSFPNVAIALLVVQLLDRNVPRAGALYALVGVQAAAAAASMGLVLARCAPPARWWDEARAHDNDLAGAVVSAAAATCWDPAVFNRFSYFVAAYTALTDAVLAAVPVAAFWRLQMPARTKLGVCLLMGLTLLSAVVTVVKACYLHLFTDVADPLWNVVPLVVWSLIEQSVVIVAACIPTLRPFFTKGVLLPVHHPHHHHASSSSGTPPPPSGASSWLGSWKVLEAIRTPSGGHRRLFSAKGGGGRIRVRAASTSDTMPLQQHHLPRPPAAGRHRSHPPDPWAVDPALADDASHKGIVRTVAVAMEWDAGRPSSAHSTKTDWLIPPPAAAAAAKGSLFSR